MDYGREALRLHKEKKGKIEITPKVPVDSIEDLSIVYTPGVAEPCRKIRDDSEEAYNYTAKANMVAVVTDGSAVLGLGNIGPEAALPVMEGKAVLFKEFAGVDAFPLCLDTQDVDEIVRTVRNVSPGFGGINLEDISAPRCFQIEERLKEEVSIPVFHDDQHGTAIVAAAGLINSLELADKKLEDSRIVINGAGAAGIATAKILLHMGACEIVMCDSKGAIYESRDNLNEYKEEIARHTNKEKEKGNVQDVLPNSDVFIGVSVGNLIDREDVEGMAGKPIIFALSNPDPEITPEEAKEGGAFVVATGRSDYPNQVNNVLAFPGVFRGLLDARAREVTEDMKVAAARAIAECVEPSPEKVIPSVLDKEVAERVAEAVRSSAE